MEIHKYAKEKMCKQKDDRHIGARACKFLGGGRQSTRRVPMARAFLGGGGGPGAPPENFEN